MNLPEKVGISNDLQNVMILKNEMTESRQNTATLGLLCLGFLFIDSLKKLPVHPP